MKIMNELGKKLEPRRDSEPKLVRFTYCLNKLFNEDLITQAEYDKIKVRMEKKYTEYTPAVRRMKLK